MSCDHEAAREKVWMELESREDFCDLWWVSYTAQKKVFKEIVKKYAGVSEEVFEKLL
jgi:hypothetical protein